MAEVTAFRVNGPAGRLYLVENEIVRLLDVERGEDLTEFEPSEAPTPEVEHCMSVAVFSGGFIGRFPTKVRSDREVRP